MTTFVSVGNATQSFGRLINTVIEIASELPQPVVIQHGNTIVPGNSGCIVMPFMEMEEFSRYISDADLLIMHAGAGSVMHAIQAGKVPVVMPRRAKYDEIIDDHQLEFAAALAEAEKVVLAKEPEFLMSAAEESMKKQTVARLVAEQSRLVSLVGEVLQMYARDGKR